MKKKDFCLRMIEYLSEGKAFRSVYTSEDYELQYQTTIILKSAEKKRVLPMQSRIS